MPQSRTLISGSRYDLHLIDYDMTKSVEKSMPLSKTLLHLTQASSPLPSCTKRDVIISLLHMPCWHCGETLEELRLQFPVEATTNALIWYEGKVGEIIGSEITDSHPERPIELLNRLAQATCILSIHSPGAPKQVIRQRLEKAYGTLPWLECWNATIGGADIFYIMPGGQFYISLCKESVIELSCRADLLRMIQFQANMLYSLTKGVYAIILRSYYAIKLRLY